jgi:hypothetical protein
MHVFGIADFEAVARCLSVCFFPSRQTLESKKLVVKYVKHY